jgi:hypothetical protein
MNPMKQKIDAIKLGGITLIISGILFFAQYLFVLPMAQSPAGGSRPDGMAAEMAVQYCNGRRIIFLCHIVFDTFNRCIVPNTGKGG